MSKKRVKTDKWEVYIGWTGCVLIQRVEDRRRVAVMTTSDEEGDGLPSTDEAAEIAQQIVDDWNFSHE